MQSGSVWRFVDGAPRPANQPAQRIAGHGLLQVQQPRQPVLELSDTQGIEAAARVFFVENPPGPITFAAGSAQGDPIVFYGGGNLDGQEQTNDNNADGEMMQAQETEMSGEQYVDEENPSVTAELAREITPEQNQFDNMVFVNEADDNLMQNQQQQQYWPSNGVAESQIDFVSTLINDRFIKEPGLEIYKYGWVGEDGYPRDRRWASERGFNRRSCSCWSQRLVEIQAEQ